MWMRRPASIEVAYVDEKDFYETNVDKKNDDEMKLSHLATHGHPARPAPTLHLSLFIPCLLLPQSLLQGFCCRQLLRFLLHVFFILINFHHNHTMVSFPLSKLLFKVVFCGLKLANQLQVDSLCAGIQEVPKAVDQPVCPKLWEAKIHFCSQHFCKSYGLFFCLSCCWQTLPTLGP